MPKQLPYQSYLSLLQLLPAVLFSLFLNIGVTKATTSRPPDSISLKGLVIFGDSLSDSNNTWRLSHYYSGLPDPLNENYQTNHFLDFFQGFLPWAATTLGPSIVPFPTFPAPPYDHGYFSNGPLTVDYLADYAGLDRTNPEQYLNLAFGASWTTNLFDALVQSWERMQAPGLRLLFQGKVLPPNFSHVVDVYLEHHPKLDPEKLYAVYFSGNDYINGFSDPFVVVATQFNNIRKLVLAGARHIFWGMVPDYTMAPCFHKGPRHDAVSKWGKEHNNYVLRLAQGLEKAWPYVMFTVGNVAEIFRTAAYDPANNFTQVHTPCTNVYIPGCDHELGMVSIFNTREASVCSKPDDYVFWDQVHVTTRLHKIISGYICQVMADRGYRLNCPSIEGLRQR